MHVSYMTCHLYSYMLHMRFYPWYVATIRGLRAHLQTAFFFNEISVQALYKSSLGKIYARDLLARSLQQISMQCLCTRPD